MLSVYIDRVAVADGGRRTLAGLHVVRLAGLLVVHRLVQVADVGAVGDDVLQHLLDGAVGGLHLDDALVVGALEEQRTGVQVPGVVGQRYLLSMPPSASVATGQFAASVVELAEGLGSG